MVLPRKTKSTGIRHELNNSTKKSKAIATNSKQKPLHTKRKKLTKRVDLNDPSANTITLRRSRRLTNRKKQLSNIPSESASASILTSNPTIPTDLNPIKKKYPLRSRLRRASLTSNNQITTVATASRRSRIPKQQDLISSSLSSMGLRNGKIVNLHSTISGPSSQTSEDLTNSTLSLIAFNSVPRQHQPHNSTLSTSDSSTNSYYNNNNNNNDSNVVCQYHYSNITNHPSLDSSKHFPIRLDILLDRPPVSREKQVEYGWNHDDRSMNIFVKHNDPCTFHRHPVAQSTDAVRCKKGFTTGIHVWEIEWNTRQRGTHAVVGVGTIKAPLHCPGYQALVGMNQDSWGWDLGRNKLYHKGVNSVYASTQYPSSSSLSPTTTSTLTDPADALNNNGISYPSKSDDCFVVPDKFYVVLDLEEGTLAYIVDGQYLGVAFNDLKDKGALYPMVSSVWGHCEITMRYINGLEPEPLQLMDTCRRVIRKRLGRTNLHLINHLTLPTSLQKPSKLYFDLEFDITANPTIDGSKLTNNFIQVFMRTRSDELNYSTKDVLVLDSTSSRKFSRHLIFQTKDPFLDNQAVGKFVNLILEDIHGCLINHQCAATQNVSPFQNKQTSSTLDSTVFAKNLLVSLQPYLSRFDHCTCVDDDSQLRFRDIIEFVLNKNGNNAITWFCDIGVYTKNRAFRLLRSSKFDKLECFTVAPENQWKPHTQRPDPNLSGPPTEAERQIFMASLVYFNGPIRRFIHVDDVCTTSNTKSVNPRSQQASYVIDDLDKVRLDYPELANFMDNVAQDKNDATGDQRMSRLYKAKHIQNDFRWEIGFLYAGNYKYCERIQRHHKNNNIYFVVDMRKGTYRQKCHDSDCQNFQGVEKPLPANTTPWLTVVNQDWDNISPRSMKETL
ncbi:unnamed protein product [Rotaria magnacalcarata]|uniref:SPRY domain-containing SOCS box protein 2 n=1 Tax=Rotaria magnacalcarata TaxID=392030 RepID=A0A819GYT5_9BILA|nr:unnamed protein product [Rotaria magnacalcarata]